MGKSYGENKLDIVTCELSPYYFQVVHYDKIRINLRISICR